MSEGDLEPATRRKVDGTEGDDRKRDSVHGTAGRSVGDEHSSGRNLAVESVAVNAGAAGVSVAFSPLEGHLKKTLDGFRSLRPDFLQYLRRIEHARANQDGQSAPIVGWEDLRPQDGDCTWALRSWNAMRQSSDIKLTIDAAVECVCVEPMRDHLAGAGGFHG